jgi:hypothetical protein
MDERVHRTHGVPGLRDRARSGLQSKLHIYGGAWDTFYLEPALELLKAFLDTRDHGGSVEILPGDLGSFMTDAFRTRLDEEMAAQLKKNGVQ